MFLLATILLINYNILKQEHSCFGRLICSHYFDKTRGQIFFLKVVYMFSGGGGGMEEQGEK